MYLVIGNWRIPWIFMVDREKEIPSPSELAQKLLNNLPKIPIKNFRIYVLGDTAFGIIKFLKQIRDNSHYPIVRVSKNRTLTDGRKVCEAKTLMT